MEYVLPPHTPKNSSFPNPLIASSPQTAPSIISSRMTDGASEDGDNFQEAGPPTGRRPTTAASSDPHRPGSAMSSATRPSTKAPSTRRGIYPHAFPGTWRSGGAFGGLGGSLTNSSRPESSTSKTSRTHVPSLASQAFFRPMSSQRLQAQRGTTSSIKIGGASTNSDAGTETNRNSMITDVTEQPEIPVGRDLPSRGTEFTEGDEGGFAGHSQDVTLGKFSNASGELPLQYNKDQFQDPEGLHSDENDMSERNRAARTSRKFSSNFLKGNGTSRKDINGHERLDSFTDSPGFTGASEAKALKAGINYQYFSGNTVFCWGGRLQNTRDRPVNVVSGLIVIIPSILFLVYS